MSSLSPGEWHKLVPKERVANLRYRRWILEEAAKSNLVRESLRFACSQDILFYLNVFGWTFDPRKQQKNIPFITFPVQDRAILFMLRAVEDSSRLDSPADVVIEKSRDMGAPWLSIDTMEWLWHWHEGMSFLMMSRNADLVDKSGDPDSLFWKIDHHQKMLPEWLMPKGWNQRKHRLVMHFENPETGSTIDGASTTDKVGVGGRRTAIFLDEFSRVDQAADILSGTADTTRCRVFNFTPWGTAHPSYRLAKRTDVRKLRLGWWEHPEKNAGMYRYVNGRREFYECGPDGSLAKLPGPKFHYATDYDFIDDGVLRSTVYDAEDKRRQNRREMAMMWDIDYAGSQYNFFEKTTILELQRECAQPPWWEGDIQHDDRGMNPRLVKVSGGPVKLWMNLIPQGDHDIPPQAIYAAGADISTGTGASNSCFSLARVSSREKVLEYATPFMPPDKFAVSCVALCRLFSAGDGMGAMFAWELNGPGVLFGKKVASLGYMRVYRRSDDFILKQTISEQAGWTPTPDNQRTLLGEYRANLGGRLFTNRSHEALEECNSFIVDGNGKVVHSGAVDTDDPTGAGVNHGDRVVADALCDKMCGPIQAMPKEESPEEIPVGSLAWRRQLVQAEERKSAW